MKSGTSANNDAVRTSLGNGNFLIAGNNGGSVSFDNDFVGLPHSLMSRVWAFDKTGTVGEVYVAIKGSDVEVKGNLYAVLSDDETFDLSDRMIEMTSDGNNWAALVNPDDGDLMSFVSVSSPGGVSNSIIAWLKSNSGTSTTTDGEDVTSWRNSVFNPIYNLEHNASVNINISGNASTLTSVPPSYETDRRNILNFTPTVLFKNNFDGIGERLFISDINESALEAQTIGGSTLYAVGSLPSNSGFFWSGIDNDELPVFGQSVLLVSSEKISFNEIRSDRSGERTDTRIIRTSLRWDDGEEALVKVTVTGNNNGVISYSKNGGTGNEITASIRNGYYHILGNSSASIIPFGNVAETIIYDTPSLSEGDNAKIESYLALKYGITLDQTTPQSYVNSEGTEIYDSDEAFDDFDHHIIGIGQDDGSSLDRRISKSVHLGNSFLTLASNNDFTSLNMSKGRISLGDGNFFVMGHNGGTIAFEGSFEGEENTLINRVWAIDKTGDFEDVYVSFMRSFSIPAHSRKLYVVLSTDQTFDGSDRVIRMTSERSNWVAKINPRDGDFMTFVSTDADLQLYDLYIKDSPDDIGEEPNTITGEKIWRSPDIWIRNKADGIEEHQNPVYKRNNPNYVYVRIRNRSNIGSTGNDQVSLYWRKAGTVSRWPESWDGTTSQDGVLMGAPIGSIDIPALDPGEDVVLSIPWQMPNPSDYSKISPNTWHFCLLARIVSEDDPMTNEQDRYTSTNARKNNNIAWNNVMVVKTSSKKRKSIGQYDVRRFGGVVSVGNPFDEAKIFSIELIKEESETGKAIFDAAEVSLEMDQTLYNAWKRGGKQSGLLNNTNDEKKKLVKGNHATLNNLRFDPNEMGTLNVSFNFLDKELTDKLKFVYHVIQKEAETGEVVGGETYVVNKDSRALFESSFKEHDKIKIKGKTSSTSKASLDKIIPNPTSNTARITYNLGGAKSAYLRVIGFYHGATKTSNNYDLDINSRETTLDLTNYSDGHYQVTLVCDGKIVEAKTLIKE